MPSIRERIQVTYYGVQSKIEWLGNVTDDRLAELYNNAGAFVFPSRLEGFGIPVLEAQLNFCPLVASDIPVFREIAGDGAVYFSPTDSADLLAAIDRAINERSTLQELGRANAFRYSWEAAAVKMVNIYNSCVQ
jgi:glycosyltransferase involved in cell wall biosynthesis